MASQSTSSKPSGNLVPTMCFLTHGVGKHREQLTSFEMALRDASIAQYNLVTVSSIFPPECKVVTKRKGLSYLTPGEIVYCVLSRNQTNEPHRLVGASVGLAIPKDASKYGYISEHHSFGQVERVAGDYAEDLAASMLATILDVPFDPDSSWDEKKEQWKISNQIVRTTATTQTAIGDKNGLWTTVVAAAIFVVGHNV